MVVIPPERIDKKSNMVSLWSIPDGKWIQRAPVDARELMEKGVCSLDEPEPTPPLAPPTPPPPPLEVPKEKPADVKKVADSPYTGSTKSDSKK